jgi:ribose transport system ATP-binding protein
VNCRRRARDPRGLGFITEDRKAEGLALAQSISDNMLLAVRPSSPAPAAAGEGS